MAFIFGDSFDLYTNLNTKWTIASLALIDSSGTKSRTGIGACACFPFGPSYSFTPRVSLVCGTAYSTALLSNDIVAFQSGATRQVRAHMLANGSISILTGNDPFPTTLGTSAPGLIQTNVYAYVELKVSAFSGAGTVTLRVNGAVVLTVTGITDPAGSGTADTFYIFGPGTGPIAYHDDVYLCDLTGTTNNDFLGALRVFAEVPNADGTPLQWSPSTPGPHFSLVNEVPPNDGTTYVQDGNIGEQDQYVFPTTGVTPPVQIFCVQTNLCAALDIAGSRSIAASINGHLGAAVGLSTSFNYVVTPFETNPNTGVAWQLTDFATARFGPEVTA